MMLFGGIKLWPIFVGRDLPLLFIREEFWQRSRTLLLRRQPLRLVDVASVSGSQPEPSRRRSASLAISPFFGWSVS